IALDEHSGTSSSRRTTDGGTARCGTQTSASRQGKKGTRTSHQATGYGGTTGMTTVQQWGRRESIIWPPRGFYYTYGAIFLAILVTALLVYVHFNFALSSLQKYYLPYYLRTETVGLTHAASTYQLVYV